MLCCNCKHWNSFKETGLWGNCNLATTNACDTTLPKSLAIARSSQKAYLQTSSLFCCNQFQEIKDSG